MVYMVIETFKPGRKAAVYARYDAKGRMLPDGLEYVQSWVEKDGDRCFQLMCTDRRELFDAWIRNWQDLVDFEIVPVDDSPTAAPRSGTGAQALTD
jgi:hypothetical protein